MVKEHIIDRYSNYKKNFGVKRLFKKIWPTECRDLSYRLLKKSLTVQNIFINATNSRQQDSEKFGFHYKVQRHVAHINCKLN